MGKGELHLSLCFSLQANVVEAALWAALAASACEMEEVQKVAGASISMVVSVGTSPNVLATLDPYPVLKVTPSNVDGDTKQ